jgi:hypothetical protein
MITSLISEFWIWSHFLRTKVSLFTIYKHIHTKAREAIAASAEFSIVFLFSHEWKGLSTSYRRTTYVTISTMHTKIFSNQLEKKDVPSANRVVLQ